jgi:hypothetical protein
MQKTAYETARERLLAKPASELTEDQKRLRKIYLDPDWHSPERVSARQAEVNAWYEAKAAKRAARKARQKANVKLVRLARLKVKHTAVAPPAGDWHVYFVHAPLAGRVKIGVSRDVEGRLRALNQQSAEEYTLLGWIRGTYVLERAIHLALDEHRVRGEWFSLTPEELFANFHDPIFD